MLMTVPKPIQVNGVFPNGNGNIVTAITADMGTITSLPYTKTISGVTADMIVLNYELGNPEVFSGNLTVTTSANSVTIAGTINGSSTVKLVLGVTQ